MSERRDRAAVSAEQRSVHPRLAGVRWWGAVLIAVTATGVGVAFDAGGGKELTHVFSAFYALGCLAAVLLVRKSGLFTAAVQPPMILFVSVPGAYFLFNDAKINGLKDILINCAYPLIERFPLMVFVSGSALLIGLARWFIGGSSRTRDPSPAPSTATPEVRAPGRLATLSAKMTDMLTAVDDEGEQSAPPPKPTRPERTEPRARRPRPSLIDDDDIAPERPRRSRSAPARPTRGAGDRHEPLERRAPRERRSRDDNYDPVEPYQPYQVPARRRPVTNGSAMANGTSGGTHHPISQVRYRGSPPDPAPRQSRTPRRARSAEPDSWEYDI